MKFVLLLFVSALVCNGFASSDSTCSNSCNVPECINSGNVDPSTAFVCKDCVAKIMSDSERLRQFREIQPKSSTTQNHNIGRTKLSHLNPDVLALIFDYWTIEQMMKFIDIYPARTLSAAAKDTFSRRYKHYQVYILSDCYGEVSVNEKVKTVTIYTASNKQFLRIFGGVFERLEVTNPDPIVSQYVNEYTSANLRELELEYNRDNALDIFKKPYKEVQFCSLTVQRGRLETGNVTLAHAFPNVSRCKLKLVNYNGDGGFFVGELPFLKSLELYTSPEKYIEYRELIQRNPQIQSLKMNELTQDFSSEISEHLVNLEVLVVSKINIVSETRFENVKQLEIREFANETMEHLSFPQLQTLKVRCMEKYKSEWFSLGISIWIEFIKRHPNVTYEI